MVYEKMMNKSVRKNNFIYIGKLVSGDLERKVKIGTHLFNPKMYISDKICHLKSTY